MIVIKRDNSEVSFNASKIVNAINKAFIEVDGQVYENDTATDIAMEIGKKIDNSPVAVTVEQIQDWVEEYLMRSERPDVARAYIRYRYKKEVARKIKDDFIAPIRDKLEAKNVQNQNANVDEHSFGGRMGEAASHMTRNYAINYLLSDKAKKNHLENRIYIHDLDHYALGDHNCLSIPFDELLAKGFNTRQTDVRPAGSVNTACQLVAVLFQLQSLNQFGGVSATHIDWTMIPYIRKSFWKHFKDGVHYCQNDKLMGLSGTYEEFEGIEESIDKRREMNISIDDKWAVHNKPAYDYAMDMTEKEIHQAVEGLYHNLNTLQSRSGNQLPFTSLNYGTCTLPEGRMFTKALLDVSIEGLGKLHKTSIFPCGIFQYMKGVNDKPGTPNYDLYKLALQSTSMRLYPNYANVDWSGNAGYDRNDPTTYFSTMGCRTVNGADINVEPGVNPQRKDGRGNICPVTIILPTLAMEAVQSVEDNEDANGKTTIIDNFMTLLDKAIFDAKDMLIERFKWICSQDPSSAKFMYENNTMSGYHPEEGIISALKHGTLVVG